MSGCRDCSSHGPAHSDHSEGALSTSAGAGPAECSPTGGRREENQAGAHAAVLAATPRQPVHNHLGTCPNQDGFTLVMHHKGKTQKKCKPMLKGEWEVVEALLIKNDPKSKKLGEWRKITELMVIITPSSLKPAPHQTCGRKPFCSRQGASWPSLQGGFQVTLEKRL